MFKKALIILATLVSVREAQAASLASSIDSAVCALENSCIPPEVLSNACGIAYLHVVKGGFVFSARIGSGFVIARTDNGWSAPSAIGTAGAGFGFQAGGKITDFILVLNNQAALDAFTGGGNVSLGAALSVAAGPVGGTAEGGVTLPAAAVYAYGNSSGLFAGVSLEGTVLVSKSGANEQFYCRCVTPCELLTGKVPPPACAKPLYRLLDRLEKCCH